MPRLTPPTTTSNKRSKKKTLSSPRQTRDYQAPSHTIKPTIACPYCDGTRIVRAGTRATKHGAAQLFRCGFCDRRFTPQLTKHRTYPMRIVVETLSRYNRPDFLRTPALLRHLFALCNYSSVLRWTLTIRHESRRAAVRDVVRPLRSDRRPTLLFAIASPLGETLLAYLQTLALLLCSDLVQPSEDGRHLVIA
jgi:transposase-like protein